MPCRGGGIGHVGLQLGLLAQAAPQHQPALVSWQRVAHLHYAQEGELSHQRAFRPFFELVALPAVGRHLPCQGIHAHRWWRIRLHPLTSGSRTSLPARRHGSWRSLLPNMSVMRHLSQIEQAEARNLVQQLGLIPELLITSDPLNGQDAPALQAGDQLGGQLGAGLEGRALGDATALPARDTPR